MKTNAIYRQTVELLRKVRHAFDWLDMTHFYFHKKDRNRGKLPREKERQ